MLKSLELWDLAGTGINGTIPVDLENLVSLKNLYLTDTFLSGLVLEVLANVRTLKVDGTDLILP